MGSHSGSPARIAIDAMGGDLGPAEVVHALKLAFAEFPDLNPVIVVGRQTELETLLAKEGLLGHAKVTLRHAADVISPDDEVMAAIKRKRDASMMRAIELVKEGEAASVVSTGNTKILVAAGTLKLRTVNGIERPALAAVIPRDDGNSILIDAGANPDCRYLHLVHNAILGTHYCRLELGVERPRVGLLTIGTEEGKGNSLVNETHEALKRLGSLVNYVGPMEGFQIFLNTVDVVICDGFTGNICLKSWESMSKFFSRELKAKLAASPGRKLGACLARGAFNELRHRIQPERYGGAPLLGLRGSVLKAHGSANRFAIMNAIHDASEFIRTDFNRHIEADIARANEAVPPPMVSA
ncbi:MAG: phosphate acyltransferase PlsX [Opitutaceae bacterium]|nr:phosphate acyltransferase PlsX [Opitutaceae bacterium]